MSELFNRARPHMPRGSKTTAHVRSVMDTAVEAGHLEFRVGPTGANHVFLGYAEYVDAGLVNVVQS